jgi:phage terminase small subunit
MAALTNEGWERFANEYLVDLNATKAYIRAGYSRQGAQQSSSRLLLNAVVKQRIEELREERAHRLQVRQDDVMHFLLPLVTSDLKELIELTPEGFKLKKAIEWPEDFGRILSSIKMRREIIRDGNNQDRPFEVIEFRLWSKIAALKELANHTGFSRPGTVFVPYPPGASPGQVNPEELTDEELERLILAGRNGAPGLATGAGGGTSAPPQSPQQPP